MKKQIALIVLDGWGHREEKENNAIEKANKPFFDNLWNTYPRALLKASGLDVGLPFGQMGNSEVGHTTIGAGRVIFQDLIRIDKSIDSFEFYKNKSFENIFSHIKKNNSVLHIIGLLSDGGVHSHISHLFAFLRLAKENKINKVAIHVITDGRDTPPQSGSSYLRQLEEFIYNEGIGEIASVSGRLYAMDRDKRWDRLEKFEKVIFEGENNLCHIKPSLYLDNLYKENVNESDEYLLPFSCSNESKNVLTINKNDGIFLFNFRADRIRMITSKLLEKKEKDNLYIVSMTDYGKEYKTDIAFPIIKIEKTLGSLISENNLKQSHIAETEKFAHATYFLNCGQEKPYEGEEQILVQSPKDVLTYDLAPKMSAEKIADTAIEQIEKGVDFIFINFANADMVGHTAKVPAILLAIEEVDKQLGRVVNKLNEVNGIAFITADHGNAEINIDENGERHTAHTTSLVPLIITKKDIKLKDKGTLADVAPTILSLFGIEKPKEMTGHNLIINN